MYVIGSASEITEILVRTDQSQHRRDALVVTLRVHGSVPTHSHAWVDGVREDLHDALNRYRPRVLVVVIDGSYDRTTIMGIASGLVEEASFLSTNLLGKEVTALGVVLDDPAHRELVAERVSEHLMRSTNIGNGTVIPSRRLAGDSIRDLIMETVL